MASKLTQAKIAAHLRMSERNLRELLPKLGMDHKRQTLDEIREAYIEHLRSVASGHQSDGGVDLTAVRARRETAEADLREMDRAERYGQICAIDQVAQTVSELGDAISIEFLEAGETVIDAISSRYDIEFDENIVNDAHRDAQARLKGSIQQSIEGIRRVAGVVDTAGPDIDG